MLDFESNRVANTPVWLAAGSRVFNATRVIRSWCGWTASSLHFKVHSLNWSVAHFANFDWKTHKKLKAKLSAPVTILDRNADACRPFAWFKKCGKFKVWLFDFSTHGGHTLDSWRRNWRTVASMRLPITRTVAETEPLQVALSAGLTTSNRHRSNYRRVQAYALFLLQSTRLPAFFNFKTKLA